MVFGTKNDDVVLGLLKSVFSFLMSIYIYLCKIIWALGPWSVTICKNLCSTYHKTSAIWNVRQIEQFAHKFFSLWTCKKFQVKIGKRWNEIKKDQQLYVFCTMAMGSPWKYCIQSRRKKEDWCLNGSWMSHCWKAPIFALSDKYVLFSWVNGNRESAASGPMCWVFIKVS